MGQQSSKLSAKHALIQPLYQAYERRQREAAVQQGLAYYLAPHATNAMQSETRVELAACFESFFQNDASALFLLLGDSGSGKSLALHQLERALWQAYERNRAAPIPLFIELKSLHSVTDSDFLPGVLQRNYGYTPEHIQQIKAYDFIFLFDGYDELSGVCQGRSLYRDTVAGKWSAKVIISCRTQYLTTQQAYDMVLSTSPNAPLIANTRWYLAPFTPHQIEGYIKRYVSQRKLNELSETDATRTWNAGRYLAYYRDIPGLLDFMSSPLLLKIITDAVPTLLQRYPEGSRHSIKRYQVYQAFIQQWFMREVIRLGEVLSLSAAEREAYFAEFGYFAERLAFEMFTHHTLEVHYTPPSLYVAQSVSPWEPFFGNTQDGRTAHARAACPLRRSGDHRYSFIHKSFMEYFVAEYLVKTSMMEADDATFTAHLPTLAQQPLGQHLLNREPAIIEFIAERILEADQQRWMYLVLYSRKVNSKTGIKPMTDAGIQTWKANQNAIKTAAANAMTILNAAQVNFSHKDLSGVRIKGANLSQGVFYQTTFNRANLKQIQAQQGMLREMQVGGAKLAGTQFGERAYWQMESEVRCLAFNDKGTLLAIGLHDGTVQLRRWPTGKVLHVLRAHTNSVTCLAWKGLQLASGSRDHMIRLWSTAGVSQRVLQEHTDWVTSLAWQGSQLASGSFDGTIRLWDSTTGVSQCVLDGHTRSVTCLAWKGLQLASGSRDGTIRLWESIMGECQRVLQGHTDGVRCLAWQGSQLASGSHDRTIRLWDSTTGMSQRVLEGHTKGVTCLAWQGSQLVSGSHDRTIRLWDSTTGMSQRVLEGHANSVMCLAWQGPQFISGSWDRTIRLWESTGGVNQRFLQGHTNGVMCLDWQESQLTSGSWDRTIRLWDSTTGKCLRVLKETTDGVRCLAWQGTQLASSSDDCRIQLWESTTGKCQRVLRGHTWNMTCLAWQGTQLASGGADGTIRLWESTTGECQRVLQGHSNYVTCLAWQGTQLASGSWGKTIRLWESTTGECQRVLQGHSNYVTCLAWQGTQLASGSGDKTIRLWDSVTGRCQHVLTGHHSPLVQVQFIHNGAYLLSWSEDGEVMLWQTANGQLLERRQLLPLTAVAFNMPDLATADSLGRVHFWQATGENLLNHIPPRLPNWQLRLMSGGARPLDVTGMNMAGAIGLSEENKSLLEQRGAVGTPATPAILPPQQQSISTPPVLPIPAATLHLHIGETTMPASINPQHYQHIAQQAREAIQGLVMLNQPEAQTALRQLLDMIEKDATDLAQKLAALPATFASQFVETRTRGIATRIEREIEALEKGNASYVGVADRQHAISLLKNLHQAYLGGPVSPLSVAPQTPLSPRSYFNSLSAHNRARFVKQQTAWIEQTLLHEQADVSTLFVSFLKRLKQLTQTHPLDYQLAKVFISYAWPSDSKPHEQWTQPFLVQFAADLNQAGITALIDREESRNGRNTAQYMKDEIEKSDFVLLIGTESLKEKHDVGLSAVCNELILIGDKRKQAQLTPGFAPHRYPPVLPILLSGSYETAFPAYFRTFTAIESFSDKSYLRTLRELMLHFYHAASQSALAKECDTFEQQPAFQLFVKGFPQQAVEQHLPRMYERLRQQREADLRAATGFLNQHEADQKKTLTPP